MHLEHHGVKGQRWGVRRYRNTDGTLTPAGKRRYSDEQYTRDLHIYGKGGAKRIKKNVEKRGYGVSDARSEEATRIHSARRRAVVGGQVGSVAGGVGGIVAAHFTTPFVMQALKSVAPQPVQSLLNDQMISSYVEMTISGGTAAIGATLGRSGGKSIGMLSGGYSPKKFRYS